MAARIGVETFEEWSEVSQRVITKRRTIIRCKCDKEFTIWVDGQCCTECNRMYNLSGQELRYRGY